MTSDVVFILAFALVFYILGATFLEGFVNYRTWSLIGPAEFKTYHRAIGPRIIGFVVFPIALSLILNIALLWSHPSPVPLWSIWLSLAFTLFAIAVSVALQIPVQREFDRTGLSLPLLRRLTSVEWLRNAAHVANAALFLWMMTRLVAIRNGSGA
jgi:hypothetical protein